MGPGPEFHRPPAAGRQVLVLGAMPAGASASTHLAAGPWCFAGREELFPEWEKRFTFAPEPLRDIGRLKSCAAMAKALCVASLPAISDALCSHARDLPPAYWQTLLMPWACDVARQIAERWLRVLAMIGAWGRLPLTVPIMRDGCDFAFATEHDFTLRGALGADYNQWLFSTLLRKVWPAAWQAEECPAPAPAEAAASRPALRGWLRGLALRLPFPPMKGLSPWQSLRFSVALLHPAHGPDHSIDPQKLFSPARPGAEGLLPGDCLRIFMASLPASIKKLRHPRSIRPCWKPRIRAASIMAYEDAAYRQKLAIWRARGKRLFYVQHGGNYGQVAVACETELVEYAQSAFVTWGWRGQQGCVGNFIPLPYPGLQKLEARRNASRKNDRIIFVGTEMPAFPYRLDAHPTPLQVLEYRRAKAVFFGGLGSEILARCLYRPYFNVPGAFLDAQWLLPRFPLLGLCAGRLLPQLLACRLLVADHHGTTMLEALAANIPCVFYWNQDAWPLTPDAQALVLGLERAGIFFTRPRDAARQVSRIWKNAGQWWQGAEVQAARQAYLERQAMLAKGNPDPVWVRTLKNL